MSTSPDGRTAVSFLVMTLAYEVLDMQVKSLDVSEPAKLGVGIALGLAVCGALCRLGSLAAVGAFLVFVLGLSGEHERSAMMAAVGLVLLGVGLLAVVPMGEGESPDATAFMDGLVKPAAATAVGGLVGTAIWVHGARHGQIPGTWDMGSYIWNPQFVVTLWAGMGAVLALIAEKDQPSALVTVVLATSLIGRLLRGSLQEALLAYVATSLVMVVQPRMLRAVHRSVGLEIALHAATFSVICAFVGYALGHLHGDDGLWWRQAVAGAFGGIGAGVARVCVRRGLPGLAPRRE